MLARNVILRGQHRPVIKTAAAAPPSSRSLAQQQAWRASIRRNSSIKAIDDENQQQGKPCMLHLAKHQQLDFLLLLLMWRVQRMSWSPIITCFIMQAPLH
jgi:hypothetical protein